MLSLNVAHMKHIALCHIFISYSVLMTMHMVKCTTGSILFVLKSRF